MVLPITPITDNPSLPQSAAVAYLPDQLVLDLRTAVTLSGVIGDTVAVSRGTVMGQVTGGTGLVGSTAPASGNTGNGTIAGIQFAIDALPGVYRVDFVTATTYTVVNPDGVPLVAAGGIWWGPNASTHEIGFTFTAGGIAMIAGDSIAIIAEPSGLGLYKQAKATATDGSEVPVAILADTSNGNSVSGGLYVQGEFNANALIIDPSFTLAQVIGLLQPRNIWAKIPVSAADPN